MKKYIIRLWKPISIFTMINVICTISLALIPLIHKGLFDSAIGDSSYSLFHLVFFYVVCVLTHLISAYGTNIWNWKIGITFERNMKRDFFSAISCMSYVMFKQRTIGEYISIQSNDITTIETDFLTPLVSFFNQIIVFAVYSTILFIYVDWRVGLTLLIASCVLLLMTNITSKKMSSKRKDYSDQLGAYTARITDFLEGKHLISRKTIPSFKREYEKIREETSQKRFAFGKYKSLVLPFNSSLSFILTIITFATIGYLLLKEEISVGTSIASLGYIEAFLSPLKEIVYDVTTIASTKEIRKKVLAFFTVNEGKLNKKNELNEALRLNNLSMKLDTFEIKDLSFMFKKNKKYAIIGHNGCGKSTIVKIINKHMTADSGQVLFDEVDSVTIDTTELVYYQGQDDHLFRDTFFNNISLFSSYEILPEIIKNTIGDKFYKKLHEQTNCQILSGGEMQIVKFVRMITENKPICIIDEPFSAMDIKTSERFTEQLLSINEKTIIVVTHNLSENLMKFDEILLMEKGRILHHGSYHEISKTNAFQELKSYSKTFH